MFFGVVRKLFCIFLIFFPTVLLAELCQDFKPDPMAGFQDIDAAQYLDLPDPDVVRATQLLESQMLSATTSGVVKAWCQVSVQRMIIDFQVPVQDDSVGFIVTRAVYVWTSEREPIGWQISKLGQRFICARGQNSQGICL